MSQNLGEDTRSKMKLSKLFWTFCLTYISLDNFQLSRVKAA